MANPLSNPSAREDAPGPTTKVTRKVGGSRKRPSAPVTPRSGAGNTVPARGIARTTTGVDTEGGPTDRILQGADHVQGQPRSAYGDGPTRGPIPNRGS